MQGKFKSMRLLTDCDATEAEIEAGTRCLEKWYVLKKYKKQVAGLHRNVPAYIIEMEDHELSFEELIFMDGKCIGVYHDELVFLFDNKNTHHQEKYMGELPTGHDQSITFIDYYDLCIK
ncbi:MAG: hypothetical protein IJY88_07825 [Clostridia bacterium]|nr:hypothetical protein [Clostridia bacterium]